MSPVPGISALHRGGLTHCIWPQVQCGETAGMELGPAALYGDVVRPRYNSLGLARGPCVIGMVQDSQFRGLGRVCSVQMGTCTRLLVDYRLHRLLESSEVHARLEHCVWMVRYPPSQVKHCHCAQSTSVRPANSNVRFMPHGARVLVTWRQLLMHKLQSTTSRTVLQ